MQRCGRSSTPPMEFHFHKRWSPTSSKGLCQTDHFFGNLYTSIAYLSTSLYAIAHLCLTNPSIFSLCIISFHHRYCEWGGQWSPGFSVSLYAHCLLPLPSPEPKILTFCITQLFLYLSCFTSWYFKFAVAWKACIFSRNWASSSEFWGRHSDTLFQ